MPEAPLKLSVSLCCYNQGHLLPRQLAAFEAQDYRPLEILLVDDGSTDNTFEVMSEFCRRVPHARVLRNERNMGLIASSNRSMLEASGDFVYGAAADDEVQPGLFSALMACAARNPDAGVIFSDPMWDLDGDIFSQTFALSDDTAFFPPDTVAALYGSGRILMIPGHTLIWNLPRYRKLGMLRPETGSICDFLPTWALAMRHGIGYVPRPLGLAHIHGGQWSRTQTRRRQQAHLAHRALLDALLAQEFDDIRPRIVESRVLSRLPLMFGPLVATGKLFTLLSPGDAAKLAVSRVVEEMKFAAKRMIGFSYKGRRPVIHA
jgi:hypothetical protein